MTQTKNSTMSVYQQLKPEERGMIQTLNRQNVPVREIARELHRSPSTISRELHRGTVKQRDTNYLFFTNYYADAGQAIYEKNHSHCHSKGLLRPCKFFFNLLTKALKKHFRSAGVDGFVHQFQAKYPRFKCPSTPTVYRYIDRDLLDVKNSDLPKKLRRRVKGKHKHSRHNKKILGTSIEERPKSVTERTAFGNWEGDLVKGRRVASEPALLTLTERMSRFEIIIKLPDYHAQTCLDALQKVIDQYPGWFKSITFDNGSEFSKLTQIKGTKIYFAHPFSPWERGSNENTNGLIREYIPKGRSLKQFTEAQIHQVQNAINDKPRKILHCLSAKAFSKTLR
ncbi:IS30 family transposase [Pediococcus damnosus]|uniref:IS30 family transposase n=1 Tax=Pediococcus damnosus TaxID=51663 RepID=UPI000C1CACDF|nr:IS30 family transposase [Pediococcus damnosus]PIO82097.1 IS30 family transposase [Pediococcus damnosus]